MMDPVVFVAIALWVSAAGTKFSMPVAIGASVYILSTIFVDTVVKFGG